MIRMGRRTGRDRIQQVAGNNQVCIGTADTADTMGRDDATRTHGAAGAGEAGFTVLAGRLLHFEAVPDSLDTIPHGHFKKRFCILIDRSCFFFLLD